MELKYFTALLCCASFALAKVEPSYADAKKVSEPAAIPADTEDEHDDSLAYDLEVVEDEDSTQEPAEVEVKSAEEKNQKKTLIRVIQSRDSLEGILVAAGFSRTEVRNLTSQPSWPKHFKLFPKHKYLLTTYKSTDRVEVVFFQPRVTETVQFIKENGKTEMKISDFNFEIRVKEISGEVKGSVYGSVRKLVSDAWIAMRFLDAFSLEHRVEKELKRGAKFRITYEERFLNGTYVQPGEVLYASVEFDGKKMERHWVNASDIKGGFFFNIQHDYDSRPFYAPVSYLHISSPFNPRRFHPLRRRYIPHKGVDFSLQHGEDVTASKEGTVLRVGRNRASGIFVVLSHADGYETEYVHLSAIDQKVIVGAKVVLGQKLGEVGCTGYCTSPHLHFAIVKDGKHIDPVKLIKPFTAGQEKAAHAFIENKLNRSITTFN